MPHEALATFSGCERHEILEQKWFGFLGGPSIGSTFQHGVKSSTLCKNPPRHLGQALVPFRSRTYRQNERQNSQTLGLQTILVRLPGSQRKRR